MRKIASLFTVLMLLCILAFGQTRTVTGQVRDENGNPIPFVTISEAGTSNATSADANGNFSINIRQNNRITLSATGFQPQTLNPSQGAQNITLRSGGQMTEVVVTALQTRRNRNEVVYANQTVKNEELNEVVNRSALNALQGKVAGVKIGQASGAPGASTRVVLRGETSLTQGNNALIVVDGIPLNNYSASGGGGTGALGDRDNYVDFGNRANDINPDDVESVTVLKGPAATSLYGSRGAAGVILITTKKGKVTATGRPVISVGSSISADVAYLVMKQQNRYGSGYQSCNGCGGGIDIFMGENFSWGAELDGRVLPWTAVPADEDGHLLPLNNGRIEQLSRPYSYVKNHLASFFDTGMTNRNNISVNGGNGRYTYFLSYTNFNNKGIVPNTNYYKNNVLLNATANFTEKLSSSFSFNYSRINQRGATEGGYPFGYSSGTPAYSFALQTPVNIPFEELRDYNSPYHDFKGFYGQYSINPYFILDQQEVKNNVDNVLSSVTINYNLFKNFTLTGRGGANFTASSVTEKSPKFSYFRGLSYSDGELSDFESPRNNFAIGGYAESMVRTYDLNFDVIGNYTTTIGRDYKITATAGWNSLQRDYRLVKGSTSGGLVIPGFYDLSNSASKAIAENASTKYRLLGAYLNTSVGFRNMLFLEYSARNDWSSTLPEGNRGFFYQAGGLSFIPTNTFDIKNNVLSYLKIRANVGSTGKDAPLYRLDNYFTLNPTILDFGTDFQIALPFNGQSGAQKSNTIGNPDLKPELSVTYEGGVDVGLLNDRINIEYTYYYANSKNQIVDVNLPWSSGYAVFPLNVGRMVNRGHELSVRATAVKNRLIDWRLFFTYARNRNEVKSVADEYDLTELNIYTGLVHFSGHGTMNLVAAEGRPFGTYKGTDYVYDPSGNIVVDATGNPKQSTEQVYLGSYQPDYIASFGTDFNIKGFSLHALFDARKGGLFFSGTKMSTEFNGTAYTTMLNDRQPFVLPNSVMDDGSGGYVKNTLTTTAYNYLGKTLPASGYLLDASYLKLRELSLSYSVPNNILGRTPFSGLSLSLFARNLKYWLPEENTFADPEVGGVGGASDAVGIETSTTPTTRSLGLDLRFTLK